MKIAVCVKSVLKEAPSGEPVRSAELCELNPFDRPALGMALALAGDDGEVTAISMGPKAGIDALYEALALGCEKAVMITDLALAGADTFATSKALAAAIKKTGPYDLVVFGARTSDSDTGQVGPETAALLGVPLVAWVTSMESSEKGLKVERKADGFKEVYRLGLPAAVTIHPRACPPGDVSLMGIEDAYSSGKIKELCAADLELAETELGLAGSPTRVRSTRRVKKDRKCEFIEGSADEQADRLMKLLEQKGLV